LAQDPVPTPETAASEAVAAPTVAAPAYSAMTSSQRWSDFISGSVASPSVALSVLGSAAMSHLSRDPVSWHAGSRGFFERAGSHYARSLTSGFIHDGLAAALGHDTRYFREPDQSGWRRARHALRRTLFTRDREGKSVFDVSNLTSIYATPMISTAWHPGQGSMMTRGLRGGSMGIGIQAVTNVFHEFGPDIRKKILGK
jgi:hypothetical protein